MEALRRSKVVTDIYCAIDPEYHDQLMATLSGMPDEYLYRCYELFTQYAGGKDIALERTPEGEMVAECWDFLDHFDDDDHTFELINFIESAHALVAFKNYFDPSTTLGVWRKLELATRSLSRCVPFSDYPTHAAGFILDSLATDNYDGRRNPSADEIDHFKWLTENIDALLPFIPEMVSRGSTDRGFCASLLASGRNSLAEGNL